MLRSLPRHDFSVKSGTLLSIGSRGTVDMETPLASRASMKGNPGSHNTNNVCLWCFIVTFVWPRGAVAPLGDAVGTRQGSGHEVRNKAMS